MTEENRIAELRKKHSLSQSQLADKLHIVQATLALYETGKRKPNIDMLNTLADFFNVSVDYLFLFDCINFRNFPRLSVTSILTQKTFFSLL